MDISIIKDIYPFKSNYFKINNYNYHYIDEGEGSPILMLHGNPTWSFFYRELIRDLRADFRVIAPDHLGCGLSDKPQNFPYRLETHIDNLEKLVVSLGLQDFTLVMHDWGAAIGMGLSIRYPKRIKRLIILNSSAFSFHRIPLKINVLRIPFLGTLLIRRFNLFCRAATLMTSERGLTDKVKKGYLLPYDSYENRVAINAFVKDIPMQPEHPSYELLLEIEHSLWLMRENPVAIIWGMKDWCFSHEFLYRWKIFYPQAEVLQLKDAGHYVLEDAENEALEFIRSFLKQNDL